MTNSDNTYGVHNKITWIYTQTDDGSTALEEFADVAAGQTHYHTDAGMAVFNECCTELQWGLVDANTLKVTMAFGVVTDPDTAGWGDTFLSRKNALEAETAESGEGNEFQKSTWPAATITTSGDHLF